MTRVAFHRSRIMIHRAISAETTTPMTVANDPASPAHNFSRSSNLSARCFFADRLTGWRRASGGNNDRCVDVWTSEVQLFFFPVPSSPADHLLRHDRRLGLTCRERRKTEDNSCLSGRFGLVRQQSEWQMAQSGWFYPATPLFPFLSALPTPLSPLSG